jgi:glycerol-3-phosphate cytidylyltransferase
MDSKKIIGFTVGVWDLLHSAHINFLERAKKHCDYLIVGIMTDYWVRVQKGQDRTKWPLSVRYEKLMETGLCDKIVILDTLDMTEYLKIADIWIKSEGQNKMRPEIYNKTVILPRTPGISTTQIIKERETPK